MTNHQSYAATVTDDDGKQRSSISYPPSFPLKISLLKTTIAANEKYRPDKVAYRLYENPLMSWVIDEVNNFYNGFSDYEQDKEIFYPSIQSLEVMGISVV